MALFADESPDSLRMFLTTRSDSYSLGVLRMIREEDPPQTERGDQRITGPSASIVAPQKVEPAKRLKPVRDELDWIVVKALEMDRTRCYETANGLARDVNRYLADKPVEAGPPSSGYRLAKMINKHCVAISTAAAFVFRLDAGLAATTAMAVRATSAEGKALSRLTEKPMPSRTGGVSTANCTCLTGQARNCGQLSPWTSRRLSARGFSARTANDCGRLAGVP